MPVMLMSPVISVMTVKSMTLVMSVTPESVTDVGYIGDANKASDISNIDNISCVRVTLMSLKSALSVLSLYWYSVFRGAGYRNWFPPAHGGSISNPCSVMALHRLHFCPAHLNFLHSPFIIFPCPYPLLPLPISTFSQPTPASPYLQFSYARFLYCTLSLPDSPLSLLSCRFSLFLGTVYLSLANCSGPCEAGIAMSS
jgi:hypothetical protein